MSRTKQSLVDEAHTLGIHNGDDIPYAQLYGMIRDVKNGGAATHSAKQPKKRALARASSKATRIPVKVVKSDDQAKSEADRVDDTYKADFYARNHPNSDAAPKVKFYRDRGEEWRWSLVAANGRIVADSSEGYATKWGCRRAFKKFIGL